MSKLQAVGKNLVLKLLKPVESNQVGKILLTTIKVPPKFYEVMDSNSDKIKPGMRVYINGYVHPLEYEGVEYFLANEESVYVILQ